MPLALNRIDVAVLLVADLERAMVFYQNTLELPLTFSDASSAYFQLEGASLLLLTVPGAQDLLSSDAVAPQHPPQAVSQLVSFVEDVDAVYADLSAKGVQFVRPPTDRAWGMRTAHFRDPEGNIWEIARPLSEDPTEK
jgi:lactoylglutathione lyase